MRLEGSKSHAQETYRGIGLRLSGCRNLTLTGLTCHGYRINLLLDGCRNVKVVGSDLDHSHAERIVDEAGQPIDRFLNLRDIGEWRAYGAGVWLKNCTGCQVVRSHGEEAMSGIVLEDCSKCAVYDCDFSYNSAWGIALWKTDHSRIMWNHGDFGNRPWAGGWGGDAAGMAMVASSHNDVIGNSLTHGGDGFFLAALANTWRDTDKGAHFLGTSDDNLIAQNDGSWSPHNAFEATFSDLNVLERNWANDSDYGFWLGYSTHTRVRGNDVENESSDGVAIEHGRHNLIQGNSFAKVRGVDVHLWARGASETAAYPSTDNTVSQNEGFSAKPSVSLEGDERTTVFDNVRVPIARFSRTSLALGDGRGGRAIAAFPRPKGWKFYREMDAPKGIEWIQAGLFTPVKAGSFAFHRGSATRYDLWAATGWRPIPDNRRLRITKQRPGVWSVIYAAQSEVGQDVNEFLSLRPRAVDRDAARWAKSHGLTHEPVHPSSRSRTGRTDEDQFPDVPTNHWAFVVVGRMLPFRTGHWDCRWYTWPHSLAFTDRAGWQTVLSARPKATQALTDLDSDWSYHSPIPGVIPNDYFALVATRRFCFQAGRYRFSTLSDDGVRLFVDGRELISDWSHHGATPDQANVDLNAGVHDLRVEYCQADGAAVLKIDWARERWVSEPVPRRSRQPLFAVAAALLRHVHP